MADIRIKDLATTATTTASDDFMAVDGATNGTRKLSAATPAFLTSVTTPSLTAPASTNLTLAGGSGNTNVILTPSGTGKIQAGTVTPYAGIHNSLRYYVLSNSDFVAGSVGSSLVAGLGAASGDTYGFISAAKTGDTVSNILALQKDGGKVGILTTSPAKTLDVNGDVNISSTTAGSSGAGALVVTGGISAGAASYIGGALTLAGTGLSATNASGSVEFSGSRSSTGGGVTVTYKTGATINWFHGLRGLVDNNWYLFNNSTSTNTLIFDYSTNAATFAGAVTVNADAFSFLDLPTGIFRNGSTGYISSQPNEGAIFSTNAYFGSNWTGTGSGAYIYLGKSGGSSQQKIFFGRTSSGSPTTAITFDVSTGAATFAGAVTVPSLFMSTDAQGSILSSSGNTLFIDAAAGGMTIRPKAGSVFHVSNGAPVRFSAYGAGTATFDSSGNITSVSDARLKNITGTFTKGLAEIVKLTPKLYTWKPETGLVTDDINATLIAQDLIAAGLSEAVTTYRTVPVMEDDVQSAEDIAAGKPVTQHPKLDADGKAVTQRVDSNYSVSDRTVIAALVNAVKELKAEIDALKAK